MNKPYIWIEPLGGRPPGERAVMIVDAKKRAQLMLSWSDERGEREWFVHDPARSQRQRQVIDNLVPDPDGRVRVSSRHRKRDGASFTWVGDHYTIEFDGLTLRHDVMLPALCEVVDRLGGDTPLTFTVDELRAIVGWVR